MFTTLTRATKQLECKIRKRVWCSLGMVFLPIPIGLVFYLAISKNLYGELINAFNPAYGFMVPLVGGWLYCLVEFFILRDQIKFEKSKDNPINTTGRSPF